MLGGVLVGRLVVCSSWELVVGHLTSPVLCTVAFARHDTLTRPALGGQACGASRVLIVTATAAAGCCETLHTYPSVLRRWHRRE